MSDNLEIEVTLQIRKPVSEVFEAIVNPYKMSCYFISKSSGRIQEGRELARGKWFKNYEKGIIRLYSFFEGFNLDACYFSS